LLFFKTKILEFFIQAGFFYFSILVQIGGELSHFRHLHYLPQANFFCWTFGSRNIDPQGIPPVLPVCTGLGAAG
jgi:hypothetical protein